MNTKKYLLYFAQEHLNFRFEEINSLLSLLKIEMDFIETPNKTQPYWLVKFKSEDDVKLLTNRSVSLRSCMELWAYSDTIEDLHRQMKQYPYELQAPYMQENQSFKIEVETFCKHFTQKEKVDKLEAFSYLPVKGKVKLKNPEIIFQYIEYYGTDPKSPPENPYMITNGLRQLIQNLSLKTRKFIGNTSMDPQLSLLMANQAQVQSGDIILDPFVGSGSLLVAAAQFGGYVLGTDIDYLMLHARTRPSRITQKERDKDESVKANMAQYNLDHKYLDVLVNDFAIQFWKDDLRFDAIITDPPYGIREATEKIGTSKENCTVSEEHLPTHIPAKIEYGLSHLYYDLLTFSAKHLKLGGKLVCWFPIFRDDYNEDGLPTNTCLKLVANSEQILNKHTSRRLLTYEKIGEPCGDIREQRNNIIDFRSKYYDTREETRKERRMKKAMERHRNRKETTNHKK
ncbi:rna methylase-related [Holotrichia oblita]|uniref:Rna methylase-related n=1 Tax=Holotrichia oblita TaxID=644536 RepID=A0ACB9SQG2_HOLOL|nr:rna methylase-related [Holotrichia oblita]